jgi:hypothetical protein
MDTELIENTPVILLLSGGAVNTRMVKSGRAKKSREAFASLLD